MQAVQKRRQSEVTTTQVTTTTSARSKTGGKRRSTQNGRRKGNPGTRVAAGKKSIDIVNTDIQVGFGTKGSSGVAPEQPLSQQDQERLDIISQIQDQIKRKGEQIGGDLVGDDEEIERLCHGYVSMCHNAAMEMMRTSQTRGAGRILRQCETFMSGQVPERVARIVRQKGILHTIMNNLAQHANMTADMNLSIEYLEKALIAAEHPETEQDLLPLAETYLNLANGYSFLSKYEQSLNFAEKALRFAKHRCNGLRAEIQEERQKVPDGPSSKVETLDFQLNDFIAIKIMAHLCVGEQQEKLGSYNAAIKFYSEGKQFAETNFGTKHPLYTKCINAMGGARLRSKYQTKEVYRTTQSQSSVTSKKPATGKSKKSSSKESQSFLISKEENIKNSINSKLMARRLQAKGSEQRLARRDIAGVVKAAEVRMSNQMRNHRDNLLLSNCDTWTSMHCHHPKEGRRRSLLHSMEKSRTGKSRSLRSSSVQSERRLKREKELSSEILNSMSDRKGPYKVVCKKGPTCKNHDWSGRSPLKKVCTRGPNCPNHDWDCSLASKSIKSSSSSKRLVKASETLPIIGDNSSLLDQSVVVPNTDRKESQSVLEVTEQRSEGHSCMLQQTERIHQQQMQHMRVMQEDQFKMMQMVLESQSSSSQQQTVQQRQHQHAYMYYPYSNGMYGGQGAQGYGYYPPQFYQGGYGQYSQAHGQAFQTDESATDTDLSDAEQIKAGKTINMSDLSKAEILEQAYQKQQEEMQEMHRRMSLMQQSYKDQIMHMRESQEAMKQQMVSRSARQVSAKGSDMKPASHKDFAEDDLTSGLEARDEVLFSGTDDKERTSQIFKEVIKRDQSAQVLDSLNNRSILKQSTIKAPSKVNYHSTVQDSPDQRSDLSGSRSFQASNQGHNRNKSFQSSFITEKSYRIPHGRNRYSKADAAVLIQKNFRRYRLRQDFLMIQRRGNIKQFLFKATVRDAKAPKIITCSLQMRPSGRLLGLLFVISSALNSRHSVKVEIDLSPFTITETDDMKDKVLTIIQQALSADDLQSAIRSSFDQEMAREILEAEFFSSDDYTGRSVSYVPGGLRSSVETIPEERVSPRREEADTALPLAKPQGSSRQQRLKEIDAEIEAIRKRCEVKVRVDVGDVEVQGHKRRFDDYQEEDNIDNELSRHIGVDQEEDVKQITISKVGIKRVGYQVGADDSEDSQHEYEFVIGDQKPSVKRNDLGAIIKIQAAVRGLLARRWRDNQKTTIYNKILRKGDLLVRLILVKNHWRKDYTLSALVQTNRSMRRSKDLELLPFSEDEASERFEPCLVFKHEAQEITELDLVGRKTPPQNPFVEGEEHIFITDYQPNFKRGEYRVMQWKLRETHHCQFFQEADGYGDITYKVMVHYQGKSDYLKLHKLPEDMFYMAYYLNEVLELYISSEGAFQYLYMKKLVSKHSFHKRMQELEEHYFGATRAKLESKSAQSSIDYGSIQRQRSQNLASLSKRSFEPKGECVTDFFVLRNGIEYVVEVHQDAAENSQRRYSILVTNRADVEDLDYLNLPQITPFIDELVNYLKRNLRVYQKASGQIDYLSLSNDQRIFSQSNRRRVADSLQGRGATDNASVRDSSVGGGSSVSVATYEKPELSKVLDQFEIERADKRYQVLVQERRNYDDRPLQITVTSLTNSKDSKYMVTRKDDLTMQELVAKLKQHLLVYTQYDEDKKQDLISYVSLSQEAGLYRRSATMTINRDSRDESRTLSKKALTKSRANRLSASSNTLEPSKLQDKSRQNHMSQTMQDEKNFMDQRDEMSESNMSPRQDRASWEELTRKQCWMEETSIEIILMAKNATAQSKNRIGRQRAPLPKGRTDTDFYKIVIQDSATLDRLSEVHLSPQACKSLLKTQSSDLSPNQSAAMTVSELLRARGGPTYDASQLEALKQSCAYSKNQYGWATVLKSVIYDAGSRQIKFDVWRLSQGGQIAGISQSIPIEPQAISIRSKLHAKRVTSPLTEEEKNRTGDTRVDGGNEVELSENTIQSARRDEAVKFEVMRKSEMHYRLSNMGSSNHGQREILSPSSAGGGSSGFEDQGDETESKTKSAFLKAKDGRFVNLSLTQKGSARYQLTVNDIRTRRKIFEKLELPAQFVRSIDNSSELEAVMAVVEERIKESDQIEEGIFLQQ